MKTRLFVVACALLAGAVVPDPWAPASVMGGADLAAAQRPGAWPGDISRDRVKGLIKDCERRTDRFRGTFRRGLRDSVIEGRPAEDILNERARRLENALDRVRKGADRSRYDDTRSGVRDALSAGRDINRAVRALRMRTDVEREWLVLRGQLNALASLFRMAGLS